MTTTPSFPAPNAPSMSRALKLPSLPTPPHPKDAWTSPQSKRATKRTEFLGTSVASLEPFSTAASAASVPGPDSVAELARALKHDVDLIYEWVYSSVDFLPLWGVHKGAFGTQIDRVGGSFEQASLMVALLRESGYAAKFVAGTIRLTKSQVENWLGTDASMHHDATQKLLDAGAMPYAATTDGSGVLQHIDISQIWVQVEIDGTNYVFDPSYKQYSYKNPVNLASILSFNESTLISNAQSGATITADYIQNLNTTNLHADLSSYANTLLSWIKTNKFDGAMDDIVGGRTIDPLPVGTQLRQLALPHQAPDTPINIWDDIPNSYRATYEVLMYDFTVGHIYLDVALYTDTIYGRRFTLSFDANNFPEVRLDGSLVARGDQAFAANTAAGLHFWATHPFNGANQDWDQQIWAPGTYLLGNCWAGTSQAMVDHHRRILEETIAVGAASTEEAKLGQSLSVFYLMHHAQTNAVERIYNSIFDATEIWYHFCGIAGYGANNPGPYFDLVGVATSVISNTGDTATAQAIFTADGFVVNAFEAGIMQQNLPVTGINTQRMLEAANAASQKIFDATSANWATGSNVRGQLDADWAPYLTELNNEIAAGDRIIIHEAGATQVQQYFGGGWHQLVADMSGGLAVSGLLQGSLMGGAIGKPQTVGETEDAGKNGAGTTTAGGTGKGSPPTTPDPISMFAGDLMYARQDFSVGSGQFPYSLQLSRHYKSSNRFEDGPLGLGWTHNFATSLAIGSNGMRGIGEVSPKEAATVIAHSFIMTQLALNSSPSLTKLLVASLSSVWLMDQLTNNAVTVNDISESRAFIKLADGTFGPPPGYADTVFVGETATMTGSSLTSGDVARLQFQGSWLNSNTPVNVSITFGATETLSTVAAKFRDAINANSTLFTAGIYATVDAGAPTVVRIYRSNSNALTTTFSRVSGSGDEGATFARSATMSGSDLTSGDVARIQFQASWLNSNVPVNIDVTFGTETLSTVATAFKNAINANSTLSGAGFSASIDPSATTVVRIEWPNTNVLTTKFARVSGSGDEEATFRSDVLTAIKNPQEEAWNFDADGKITSWVSPAGPTRTYTYNVDGTLASVATNSGRALNFTYSGTRLSSVDDGNGRSVTFSVDSDANLVSFTDTLGKVISYQYALPGELAKVFLPANPDVAVVTNTFDSLGRVNTQKGADTGLYQYFFSGRRSEEIDAVGNSHVMYFNSLGSLITDIDGLGNTTTYERDGLNRLTSMTMPEGNAMEFSYDENNNVLTKTWIKKPGSGLVNIVQTFTYDPDWNRVATFTDGRTETTTYTYQSSTENAPSRLKRIDRPTVGGFTPSIAMTYNDRGQPLTRTDETGIVDSFEYDATTEVLLSAVHDFGTGELNLTTSYDYDAFGNATTVTDRRTNAVTFAFDSERRLTQRTEPLGFVTNITYNENGWRTAISRETDTTGVWQTFKYEFAPSGKMVKAFDPAGRARTFAYDENGRLNTKSDAENRSWQFEYDPLSRVSDVIDPTNAVVELRSYTPNGRLLRTVDGNSNATEFVWDGFDRLSQRTYADTTFESYTFDENGNVLTQTSRKGDTTTNTYDALNRLSTRAPTGLPTQTITYDLAGRTLVVNTPVVTGDPTSGDYKFFYDTAGRLLTQRTPASDDVVYELDENGNRTKLTWPDGYFAEYVYDEMNRLTAIKLNGSSVLSVGFFYDKLSRRTLHWIADTGYTTGYGYWRDNSLAFAGMSFSDGNNQFSYSYNLAQQVTGMSVSDPDFLWMPPASELTAYGSSNSVNEYDEQLTYDANGCLTAAGSRTFSYDSLSRLTGAGGTASLEFLVDPFDRQAQKTSTPPFGSPVTTNYLFDMNKLIAETDDTGALIARYIYSDADNEPLIRIGTDPVTPRTYMQSDRNASVVAVTGTGTTQKTAYSPTGESSALNGTIFGFNGRKYESEVGLYGFGVRYYDPSLGRFLQPDPMGYLSGDLNLYTFANNDPVNFSDSGGFAAESVAGNLWAPIGKFVNDIAQNVFGGGGTRQGQGLGGCLGGNGGAQAPGSQQGAGTGPQGPKGGEAGTVGPGTQRPGEGSIFTHAASAPEPSPPQGPFTPIGPDGKATGPAQNPDGSRWNPDPNRTPDPGDPENDPKDPVNSWWNQGGERSAAWWRTETERLNRAWQADQIRTLNNMWNAGTGDSPHE